MSELSRFRGRTGSALARAALAAMALGSTACSVNELLDTPVGSRVLASNLDTPASASILVNSVIEEFQCAFTRYIVAGGLTGDEFNDSNIMGPMQDYDSRRITTNGLFTSLTCNDSQQRPTVYETLSGARWIADLAIDHLTGWTDAQVVDRNTLIATANAYSGYAHILLGEGMCSAAFDLGPEQSPAQIFQRAVDRFTAAATAAQQAGNNDLLRMALVGRARAKLDLGQTAAAATDAALVPDGYVRNGLYSAAATRTQNSIFVNNEQNRHVTVGELYRNVTYQGVRDPRINVVDGNQNSSNPVIRLWVQKKYSAQTSSVPIASWREARLISAEAALAAGDPDGATTIINALHQAAGIPAYGGGDATATTAQLVYERRAELFLESHHFGDRRRYGVTLMPLVPAAGSAYPGSGGGLYAAATCFPLPDIERFNNPNLSVQ